MRYIRALKRKKFIILFFYTWVIVISNWYIRSTVYPNTTIGALRVDGKTKSELYESLRRVWSGGMHITVQDRQYDYTYEEFGIKPDISLTMQQSFAANEQPFPFYLTSFIHSIFSEQNIPVPLTFTPLFSQHVHDSVYDFTERDEQIFLDSIRKKFIVEDTTKRYILDEGDVKHLLLESFGSAKAIRPRAIRLAPPKKELLSRINTLLPAIWTDSIPLTVINDKHTLLLSLSTDDVKEITKLDFPTTDSSIPFHVDYSRLQTIIAAKLQGIYQDKTIPIKKIGDDLQVVMTKRYTGDTSPVPQLTMTLGTGPSTTGDIADKYIEVDISQQEMYLFWDGNLYKTYRISTGRDYPTPVGTFHIMNKAPDAYSAIYNVWMPYWMAFTYAGDVKAYLGIHELPYKLVSGQKVSRPPTFIGTPNTGGCIALGIGEAKEVYDFSDVGMPVTIVN